MYLNDRLEHKFTQSWDGDYNSSLGRFISEDPVGFSGRDANLYRYAFNKPNQYTDPSGKFVPFAVIAGALVADFLISTSIAITLGAAIKFLFEYQEEIYRFIDEKINPPEPPAKFFGTEEEAERLVDVLILEGVIPIEELLASPKNPPHITPPRPLPPPNKRRKRTCS